MINHEKQYEEMCKAFKDIQQEYLCFKQKISLENRYNLLDKIKKFDEKKTMFRASVKNIFLK